MTENITGKLGAKTVTEKCPPEVYFGVSAEQSYPNSCRTLQNTHIGNDLDGPYPYRKPAVKNSRGRPMCRPVSPNQKERHAGRSLQALEVTGAWGIGGSKRPPYGGLVTPFPRGEGGRARARSDEECGQYLYDFAFVYASVWTIRFRRSSPVTARAVTPSPRGRVLAGAYR